MCMKKCVFQILHYGNRDVTDACIRSILEMDQREQIHILVVDNDTEAPAAVRKALAGQYAGTDCVTVLPIRKKSGFSRANNMGYRYARTHLEPSHIVVCNNDVVFPQRDFVKKLYETNASGADVLAPGIVSAVSGAAQNPLDTQLRTPRQAKTTILLNRLALALFPLSHKLVAGRQNRGTGHPDHAAFGDGQPPSLIVPMGACIIFTGRFLEAEEYAFMPETAFYYEEYILAARCQREGYRTGFFPQLRVIHADGAATGNRYEDEKERLRFMMKHMSRSARIYLEYIEGS